MSFTLFFTGTTKRYPLIDDNTRFNFSRFPNNNANTLSGGNQQRIVLAKWLACNPEVLILNGPTVGVDIGSKHDIHAILQGLAKDRGMGVIIISDDLPEVIQSCSRVLVLKDGKIAADLPTEGLSEQVILDHMM